MSTASLSGRVEKVYHDLAVFLLRGALTTHDNSSSDDRDQVSPHLDAASTPENMTDLKRIATGMKFLRHNRAHPDCPNPDDCLTRAYRHLNDRGRSTSTGTSDHNPVAAYGLALIALHGATKAARRLDSALVVENHLRNAYKFTTIANQSAFLRENRQVATTFRNAVRTGGLVPGRSLVSTLSQFSCAMASYRRGQWHECLSVLRRLTQLPPILEPYVDAAKFDSRLNAAPDSRFAIAIDELRSELDRATNDKRVRHTYMLGRVLIQHVCNRGTLVSDAEFESLVQNTLAASRQGDRFAYLELVVLAADCRSPSSVWKSLTFLEDFEASAEGDEVKQAGVDLILAGYYSRRMQLTKALEHATWALILPWTADHIATVPTFNNFVRNNIYYRDFLANKSTSSPMEDMEWCITFLDAIF